MHDINIHDGFDAFRQYRRRDLLKLGGLTLLGAAAGGGAVAAATQAAETAHSFLKPKNQQPDANANTEQQRPKNQNPNANANNEQQRLLHFSPSQAGYTTAALTGTGSFIYALNKFRELPHEKQELFVNELIEALDIAAKTPSSCSTFPLKKESEDLFGMRYIAYSFCDLAEAAIALLRLSGDTSNVSVLTNNQENNLKSKLKQCFAVTAQLGKVTELAFLLNEVKEGKEEHLIGLDKDCIESVIKDLEQMIQLLNLSELKNIHINLLAGHDKDPTDTTLVRNLRKPEEGQMNRLDSCKACLELLEDKLGEYTAQENTSQKLDAILT